MRTLVTLACLWLAMLLVLMRDGIWRNTILRFTKCPYLWLKALDMLIAALIIVFVLMILWIA